MDTILTPDEVRAYISDSDADNHLLDGVEFTDTRVELAMKMALDDYNIMPPKSTTELHTFPSISILLMGTLYHLYLGQASLAARNQMSYSDGGLTIPIEERVTYYTQLSEMYKARFYQQAREYKTHMNMESGWDTVHSDYSLFPNW